MNAQDFMVACEKKQEEFESFKRDNRPCICFRYTSGREGEVMASIDSAQHLVLNGNILAREDAIRLQGWLREKFGTVNGDI